MTTRRSCRLAFWLLVGCVTPAFGVDSQWVYTGVSGRLIYAPDAQGDRIPDFSDVGYGGGKTSIPNVATAVAVSPIAGDDTANIQAAIDQVSLLPIGPDGFRGAVSLAPGEYQIANQLQITTSGVVLRGAGREAGGTTLRGTGTGQRDLIQIIGTGSQQTFGSTRNLVDKVVPVGARSFRVDSTSGFSVGDTVRVERPSTADWISDLGMDMIPPRSDGGVTNQWQPGSFNVRFDRVITRIEGDRIFVDAPLTNSFEQQYGGGTIKEYAWNGRIENVGVEGLRAESDFTSETDEDHAWNFVTIDKAQNAWVRDTASANFGGSAVLSHPGAKWVTVSNARNETPKSLITGSRRYTFDLSGQLELVTGSEANEGRHDFVNNSSRPAGPHVFHNSIANNALDESGPHQRWATGTLFDNITVDGDQINARNRGNFGTGHGWAGANMVIWNSTAESYIVQNPPTAQNWLVGSTGDLVDDQTFGPQPAAYVDSHGERVGVDSLYESQLSDSSVIDTFVWNGGVGAWEDPAAWRQNLSPGAYRVQTLDYLVGDIDDYVNDGSGSRDDAYIAPEWRSDIEAASTDPIVGFDANSGSSNVAFTVEHQLGPGERVVHGSLALALKQSGGDISTDFVRLFDDAPEHRRTFSELGWADEINASGTFVGVIDLGGETDHLQTGAVNVQISEDTATDWALLTLTVASPTNQASTGSVTVRGGGEVMVSNAVGDVGSLTIGGESGGVLSLQDAGVIGVVHNLALESNGTLRLPVADVVVERIAVAGDALVEGSVELTLAEGYDATWGDRIPLLSVAGTVFGMPILRNAPMLGDGLAFSLEIDGEGINAVVVLKGDYNRDGRVDAADYVVWRDSLGTTALSVADGNNDGIVDAVDYQIWKSAYGAVAHVDSIPTPEPSGLASLFILLARLTVSRKDASRGGGRRSTLL